MESATEMTNMQLAARIRVLSNKLARDFKRGAGVADLLDSYGRTLEHLGGRPSIAVIERLLRSGLSYKPRKGKR